MSMFRRRRGIYSFPVPPPLLADGPVSMTLHAPTEQDWPRLRVRHARRGDGFAQVVGSVWCWEVTFPDGRREPKVPQWHPSWREALAVGLAALEQASVAGSRP